MAQEIRNRRGDLVVSIPDGVVLMPSDPTVSSDGPTLPNTNTSLFQVGRDVLDYGLEVSENLHWIMENFANSVPPQNPVDGQLWWDLSSIASPVMKVFNTSTGGWSPVVKLSSDTNPTLSADLNAAGRKVINLGAPVSAQDAATKQYVDAAIAAVGGGVSTFLSLTDTPFTYSGQAGKLVRVNSTNTGLEFYKLKFTDLDGVPGPFTGQNGKYVRVNTSGSALEYVTPNITHIDWTSAISINAQGTRITNIASPSAAQDAATKGYVDTTAAAIIGSALPTSDGIVVKTGSISQARSVVAGNDGILIANGNGVGGNITLSHKATGAGSSINSGANVIQSIALDAYGHINSIGVVPITNALGYVPVNKAGDTMSGNLTLTGSGAVQLRTNGDILAHRGNNTGVIFFGNSENHYLYFDGTNYQMPSSKLWVNGGQVWSSTNQGTGTGMNADLLDGLDWGTQQDVNFGIVHAHTPNASTTGGVRVDANPAHQNSIIQFTSNNFQNQLGFLAVGPDGQLNYNNGRVWHSLNDGAGTGMDADLLDGLHATDIINQARAGGGGIINGSIGTPGWARFGFGNLLIQWGHADVGNAWNVYFPVTFSTVFSVTLGTSGQYFDDSRGANVWLNSVFTSGFNVGGGGGLYYVAIGV